MLATSMSLQLIYLPVTVTALLVLRYYLQRRTRRLPPGPKGRFLVGNLFDLLRGDAEKAIAYVKWCKYYGAYPVSCDCLWF